MSKITDFQPPQSASVGEPINIPIQITNTGTIDFFEAEVLLYDESTGERLFRGYQAPFEAGAIFDYIASVVMPDKDLPLLLELWITESPVAEPQLVDSRKATIKLPREEIPWLAILVIAICTGGAVYLINESNVLGG